ncbi:MAG: hypothetical protein ACREM8_07925 [Vulcanimicrobiaceae bacterium]
MRVLLGVYHKCIIRQALETACSGGCEDEPAGAIALAGLLRERAAMRGRRVAAIVTGGNVDRDIYARVLAPA